METFEESDKAGITLNRKRGRGKFMILHQKMPEKTGVFRRMRKESLPENPILENCVDYFPYYK